jgi:hypothetical protein
MRNRNSLLYRLLFVATIVIFEVFIQKTKIQDVLSDKIHLIEMGRYGFVILMILVATSLLFRYGIKHDKKRDFISIGSVFTTILIIISSYFFGIWVVKFSKYNELYGSIGTLLIVMFYIWINCMVLLLGFDLNASIHHIKREKQKELELTFITPFLEQYNIVSEEYFLIHKYDAFAINTLKDGIYKDELVSFRICNSSYSLEGDRERIISTSFYSTNADSDFELNRMIIIGKVGQMLLNNKNNIISGWNELSKKRSIETKETHCEIGTLEKELRELKLSLKEIEKEEVYNELKNGMHFKMDMEVELNINNTESKYISYIKILSTKNKSVVVKYIAHHDEDFSTATVRVMHLERFITRYSNLLTSKVLA